MTSVERSKPQADTYSLLTDRLKHTNMTTPTAEMDSWLLFAGACWIYTNTVNIQIYSSMSVRSLKLNMVAFIFI